MEIRHHLEQNLRLLHLRGMLENLDLRISQATEGRLGHLEFLSLVIQDEMESRNHNRFRKILKAASFGNERTFEEFDFRFNETELPSATLRDLATCRFVDLKQNVLIAGPPGIGKTHVAKAIGHEACRRKLSVLFKKAKALLSQFIDTDDDPRRIRRLWKQTIGTNLLIIDDFAFRKMTPREAETFYEIVDERLGNGSVILTSNRPPEDWLSMFPDPVMGGAILDRIASSAIKIIVKKAKSFRKEGSSKKPLDVKEKPKK